MRYVVILAGGAGTRLWPMSRHARPKQLLRLVEGSSLLQLAAQRVRGLVSPERLLVCTAQRYGPQVLEELAMLPESQLLGEPVARDTANAVGLAAAVLFHQDPDATLAMLTADHVIEPVEVFRQQLLRGFELVDRSPQTLVTFGIEPTSPATGYGYLQMGEALTGLPGDFPVVRRVKAFKEKPSLEIAQQYVASGDYLWNSGMFVWRAATVLGLLERFLPACYQGVMEIGRAWLTPHRQEVLERVYPTLPKISIDFAVMEKAPQVATLALPIRWLDVGSWPSLAEILPADEQGHRHSGATLLPVESQHLLVASSEPHLIATLGVENLLIVHTPDATLVAHRDQAEKLKELVARLPEGFR